MTQITLASFAHEESNVTPEEFRSALHNAQLAQDEPTEFAARVSVFKLDESRDARFYQWLGVSAWKSGVVAIVEVRPEIPELILVAVLYQNLLSYDLHPLWEKRKTARKSK